MCENPNFFTPGRAIPATEVELSLNGKVMVAKITEGGEVKWCEAMIVDGAYPGLYEVGERMVYVESGELD